MLSVLLTSIHKLAIYLLDNIMQPLYNWTQIIILSQMANEQPAKGGFN